VSADELIIAINISHYLAVRDWTRYGQQRVRCCQFYVVSMQLVLPLLLLPLLFGKRASATTRLRRFIRRALVA